MRRDVTHQLVGYDPITESLAFELDIPLHVWNKVRSLLTQDNDDPDPDCVYSYPLGSSVAHDIMGIIGARGAQGLHYYIECFAHA